MKKITALLAVVIAAIAMTAPAQAAGFRFGPRVGLEVNKLHLNKEILNSDNRAGFTGGIEAELSTPLGFALDASLMYVRRSIQTTATDASDAPYVADVNKDYISIPVNLKWKFGLPIVGKVLSPYLFTGPEFAFLTSKKAINDAWKNHTVDVAWNFGLGVELFSHLQVGASYGLGITKLVNKNNAAGIDGKNNYWTVTAAYLF